MWKKVKRQKIRALTSLVNNLVRKVISKIHQIKSKLGSTKDFPKDHKLKHNPDCEKCYKGQTERLVSVAWGEQYNAEIIEEGHSIAWNNVEAAMDCRNSRKLNAQ